jgi:hypothetical protein
VAVTVRKSEPAPSSATDRLAATQAALEEANAKLAELNEQRNAALLEDRNADAIALGVEATNLKLSARAHEDKIQLLRDLAERESDERLAKQKAALIERVEEMLADRDTAAAELAAAIRQADGAFRKMLDHGQAVIASWPWASHDIDAMLLSPRAVILSITHEFYKVGARPRNFGGADRPGDGIDFPGGVCPDHRLRNLQEQIKPLVDVCAAGSTLASSIMRIGRSTSYIEPAVMDATVPTNGQGEPPRQIGTPPSDLPHQRSDAERRLGELWRRQAELAENPSADETEYQSVIAAIAQAQTEIDAARRMERQHG